MGRRWWNGIAVLGLLGAVSTTLTGCIVACPAIGYINTSPTLFEFTGPLPIGAKVSACYGDACDPAVVQANDDGIWEVPQEVPYLADASPIGGTRLRVVVESGEQNIIDNVFDIPMSVERTGFLWQCPGPVHFERLRISIAD
ncbi:hypothetical protein [Cryobacterium mannosilyticum]|uniref:Uncharacterized protein n=1 Tax=Cryobacterium mannosilyticum TaxID=1259190 RepID=A0A4R8WAG3_9MICO|nr:hypothetical protein [Cryobacterium mannosilyticum]TFC03984.1 hypothetical protein E3O32_08925 [Cryobacterium mannosilyticum]